MSSFADNINPGYLDKRKRNRNLFSLVVNSRPLKGAWPKESGVKWGGSPITIYDRMKNFSNMKQQDKSRKSITLQLYYDKLCAKSLKSGNVAFAQHKAFISL